MGILEGGLRLQSCQISAPKESWGHAVFAGGSTTQPFIVGCQLSGGRHTVVFGGGAKGRLEGCQISGARMAGLFLATLSTSPAVSDNSFRDCRWGVYIVPDVDAAWALGPGNTFATIAEANVVDRRGG